MSKTLDNKKPLMRRRFHAQGEKGVDLPNDEVPSDPARAWALGVHLGRKAGYSDGLVDGVELGIAVSEEAAQAMNSLPLLVPDSGGSC